jgi:predicted metal-dependent hydrolase
MARSNGGAGWFWQALGEAHLALKRAIEHLKNQNVAGARQSLDTARQRINLAGKTLGQLKSKTLTDALAHGHVAIQKAQQYLSAQRIDTNTASAESKKARGAIGAAMREALKAKGRTKIWN